MKLHEGMHDHELVMRLHLKPDLASTAIVCALNAPPPRFRCHRIAVKRKPMYGGKSGGAICSLTMIWEWADDAGISMSDAEKILADWYGDTIQ